MAQFIYEGNMIFPGFVFVALGIAFSICLVSSVKAESSQKNWQIGKPIVTYWAGPPMTDETAKQMAEGNWNLVWCRESELDTAHKYGLRALLYDPLLNPTSLDQPEKKAELYALIQRVKDHPALYLYFIIDEPSASMFPELGKLTDYLRKLDPSHIMFILILTMKGLWLTQMAPPHRYIMSPKNSITNSLLSPVNYSLCTLLVHIIWGCYRQGLCRYQMMLNL